jgi:hypothetical protein
LCPDPEIRRHRPTAPVQNARRNCFGVFTNRHRTRAPAVKEHAFLRPQIREFLQQTARRDTFGNGKKQELALLVDCHRGSCIRGMAGSGPYFAMLQPDPLPTYAPHFARASSAPGGFEARRCGVK